MTERCKTRAFAVVLVSALPLHSAEYTARWIRNTDGHWFDVATWDIGPWPDNAGSDIFDVVWDAHPVTVDLNKTAPVTIRNLTFSEWSAITVLCGSSPAPPPLGTYTVTITGRAPGDFDHLTVSNKLRLRGAP